MLGIPVLTAPPAAALHFKVTDAIYNAAPAVAGVTNNSSAGALPLMLVLGAVPMVFVGVAAALVSGLVCAAVVGAMNRWRSMTILEPVAVGVTVPAGFGRLLRPLFPAGTWQYAEQSWAVPVVFLVAGLLDVLIMQSIAGFSHLFGPVGRDALA